MVTECRIAQTIAERKQCFDCESIIIPIADIDTLFIEGVTSGNGKGRITRGIFDGQGITFCKFPAGIDFAIKDIDDGFTASLTGQICVQDSADLIQPWHGHRCSGRKDNDGTRIDFTDFLNQIIVTFGHVEVLTVETFRLVCLGQPYHQDHGRG